MMNSGRNETSVLAAAVVASVAAAVGIMAMGSSYRQARRKTRKTYDYEIPKTLLDSPHGAQLQLAVRVALEAGRNMEPHCEHKGTDSERKEYELGIETKGRPEDFCTAIDVENEAMITRAIKTHFSTDVVIGEETTGTGAIPPLMDQNTWIIDPIDGTTNFASGMPLTCVSIGYCVDRKPVMGVVYAPMTNELYLAVKGHGAFRNGARLLAETTQKKPLSDAIVNVEFGYARSEAAVSKMTKALGNVMNHGCRTVRCLGSGVLDLCYVATGRLDVVYAGVAGEGWKPWDYCAGVVIVNETGCAIEALLDGEGEEFDLYSTSIVCATHHGLMQECRDVVRNGI